MKWIACFGAVIVWAVVCSGAQAQASDKGAEVDQLFASWDRKDSPGCVVLVRQGGKTLHERAYGMANLELGVPLSVSSVFLLASVSKQFLVFCILLLVQGGRISLDDDVRKYVTELPDFGKTITIRHLIHHTSGLREDLTCFNLSGWRSGDTVTRDDFLRFVKNQKDLNFEPGSEYLYCNTGYHLLSIVVERVTGKSMPTFAKEKIFDPLGMKSTVVRENSRALIPNLVGSYGSRFGPKGLDAPSYVSAFQLAPVFHDPPGASNIHSTVGDLARWDQNFYDATVGDKKLLDMMQTTAKLNGGKEIKYAGGLIIETYRGLKTVAHSGFHGGYKTIVFRFPEERFSIIILANLRDFNPLRMAKKIADVYLSDRLGKLDLPADMNPSPDSARLAEYAGEYRVGYSIWRLGQDKRGLFVQADGGPKKSLVATAPNEYLDKDEGTRYRLAKRKDNPVVEVNFDKQMTVGRRIRPAAKTSPELDALAGIYRSGELGTFGSLEKQAGKLILVLPKKEAVLQFLDNGECIARPKDAFFSMFALKFTKNDDGAVTGYTLSTDRVRNLRYTKVKIE